MASILYYLKVKEGGGPTHGTEKDNSFRQQDKVSPKHKEPTRGAMNYLGNIPARSLSRFARQL